MTTVCRARIHAAEQAAHLADFTAAQVDKARELIADGGLVPTSRGTLYSCGRFAARPAGRDGAR